MVADESDNHNVLWSVLSYFIFIVGIILALVWWKSRNTNAKAALYGTGCSIVDRILKAVLLSSSFNFIGYLVGTLVMFIVGLVAAIMLGNRANNE